MLHSSAAALLFICGAGLFKRMTNSRGFWPLSHLVGLGLFALLGLWAVVAHPRPLTLHLAASALFVIVSVWEWGSFHGGWRERWAHVGQKSN